MDRFKIEFGQYKKYLLLGAGVFMVALIIGFFAKAWLSPDKMSYLEQYIKLILQQLSADAGDKVVVSSGAEFRQIFNSNFLFLLLWWACGLWVFGYLPAYGLLACRGFLLGLVMSLLLGGDMAYGLIILIILLLPANLLLVPVYLGATAVSSSYAREVLHGGGSLLNRLPYYTMIFGCFILLVLAGSWLQGVATPFLLKGFMSLI